MKKYIVETKNKKQQNCSNCKVSADMNCVESINEIFVKEKCNQNFKNYHLNSRNKLIKRNLKQKPFYFYYFTLKV